MYQIPLVYFWRPTVVRDVHGSTLPARMYPRPQTEPWRPNRPFHHVWDSWNVSCTAVDSTFLVLLCLGRKDTFVQTAQILWVAFRSPFRATVTVRRWMSIT